MEAHFLEMMINSISRNKNPKVLKLYVFFYFNLISTIRSEVALVNETVNCSISGGSDTSECHYGNDKIDVDDDFADVKIEDKIVDPCHRWVKLP